MIVPINMSTSGKIVALRDSFLCSTVGLGVPNTDISAGFNPASSAMAFCCSGIDFIVQTIENGEWAFLMAMGTVVKKTLRSGESILVDGDSILCFESSVTVDVRAVGGIGEYCIWFVPSVIYYKFPRKPYLFPCPQRFHLLVSLPLLSFFCRRMNST